MDVGALSVDSWGTAVKEKLSVPERQVKIFHLLYFSLS